MIEIIMKEITTNVYMLCQCWFICNVCYYLFCLFEVFKNLYDKDMEKIEKERLKKQQEKELEREILKVEGIVNLMETVKQLENKIVELEKRPTSDISFVFESQSPKRGFLLNSTIHYGVNELHMLYNISDYNVFGVILTNYIDGFYNEDDALYFKENYYIDEDGNKKNLDDYYMEDTICNHDITDRQFYIGLDRIIRPGYNFYSTSYKISILSDFFRKFHSLKRLVLHHTDHIDLLKINVCMKPLMEVLKKEQGIHIEIWHKYENGMIEKSNLSTF